MDGLNDFLLYGILPQKVERKELIEDIKDMDDILDIQKEKEINIGYIIKEKPKPKIVREFLRQNLASIKSEEELMFNIEI